MNRNAANTNAGETEITTVTGKLVRIQNLTDRFGQVEIGHSALILPGDSLVISGFDTGYAKGGRGYERTFAIGDMCRYGGMNLDYVGMITSITAKTVTVSDGNIVKRLTVADFARKNRFFSIEAFRKAERRVARLMAEDLAIRRAARALRDAAWTDSRVSLDPNEVRNRLERDAKTAGYMMTPEQCDDFVMAEASEPALLQLVKDFPITHAYLNTFG